MASKGNGDYKIVIKKDFDWMPYHFVCPRYKTCSNKHNDLLKIINNFELGHDLASPDYRSVALPIKLPKSFPETFGDC
jgi:hypothetical protein